MARYEMLWLLLLPFINLVCGNVPVLLWESSKSDRINYFPALHRMKNEDFQQYLLKKVQGEQPVPLIVVFVEENLSIEDFSWKDSAGQGYFPQLKYVTENAANVEFQTSVQDPIKAVKGLSEFGYSFQSLDSKEASDFPDSCGKILVVKLEEADSNEDRPDLLIRHDMRINEIYSQLLSKCSHVIGILSGEQSSWVEPEEVSRMRRSPASENVSEVTNDTSISNATYLDKVALLYSKTKPRLVVDGNEVNFPDTKPNVSGDTRDAEIKLVVKYGSEHWLTFNFENRTWFGYWFLRSVNYDFKKGTTNSTTLILKTTPDIIVPLNSSYHSGSSVIFFNKTAKSTLTFNDLQLQPFFLYPGSTAFGPAVDTVGFFTPAIWSGIFVTFLLGLIFTWGLCMIMDIRTMDQFDDPKGKTITVTATE